MADDLSAVRVQVIRQVAHWRAAVVALDDFENFASATAWGNLERYLGVAIRTQLQASVERLRRGSDVLEAELRAAETLEDLERVRRRVVAFRRRFLQVELALDFYGDAVNTRTSPKVGAMLRACDILAGRSMDVVFQPMGRKTPPTLTYVDKGIGASILRSGLRLWDGRSLSVASAIKVTRHNLGRPTAVLHEAGHQVSFSLGWNEELAAAFEREFRHDAPDVGEALASWSSEIAGDAFAFCHAGYAAVAALHDVIAGEPLRVWWIPSGDPHPPAQLRVLIGTAMARRFYGAGPWDDLERSWTVAHPISEAPRSRRRLHASAMARMPRIADVCLTRAYPAFGARALSALVDPLRVRPDELARLERDAGTALFTSPHWIWNESLRLLALSGYRAATEPERATSIAEQFETWMTRLGQGVQIAA